MKKLFEKNETLICMLLIAVYVVVNSYCLENFGTTDYRSALINGILMLIIFIFMLLLGRVSYYGLKKVTNSRKYLYFIPLILIPLVNCWNGIKISNTSNEILYHILTMISVGFLEEIIFRGFLFKMMEKSGLISAMLVSSLTFGIGHIVNLFSGADLTLTLMQICYSVAVGFLFVTIFHKSKRLWPCIITHAAINSLSIFYVETTKALYEASIFLIVFSIVYSIYINIAVKEQ